MPKPTPEEKLFAVIQGAPHAPLRARGGALSLAVVGGRLAAWVGPIDLPRVNGALTVILIGMGAACVFAPLAMQPRLSRVLARAEQRIAPFVLPSPLDGLKATELYVQAIRDQDPFRVGRREAPPAPVEPPPAAQGPTAQELVSDFKLVGISWAEEPIAMIEDTNTLQTHVLKRGEALGSSTVKEILPDRVILRINEADVELF